MFQPFLRFYVGEVEAKAEALSVAFQPFLRFNRDERLLALRSLETEGYVSTLLEILGRTPGSSISLMLACFNPF